VTLRPATEADVDQVWAWNNAPEVRTQSKDSHPIPLDSHRAWFAQRLVAVDPMWIVEDDGVAVGTLRVDRRHGVGYISIALGAHARGRGVGRRAIREACAQVLPPVVAEIKATNAASRACFKACGFELVSEDDELATYRWTHGG